jgi:hypothetical protein
MTASFLFDEDLNRNIVRGLLRRVPELEHALVSPSFLHGSTDDEILAAAAARGMVVVSHDVNTMTTAHRRLVATAEAAPGLILVPQGLPIGLAIEDLELVCRASNPGDWNLGDWEGGVVLFLPL